MMLQIYSDPDVYFYIYNDSKYDASSSSVSVPSQRSQQSASIKSIFTVAGLRLV
jgi:hypothetical protein